MSLYTLPVNQRFYQILTRETSSLKESCLSIGLSKQFENRFIVHPLLQSSFIQLIPLCLCSQIQVKRSYSAVRVETLKKKVKESKQLYMSLILVP